jgi:hypothetical protein
VSLTTALLWLAGAGAVGGIAAGFIDPHGFAMPGFIRVKAGDSRSGSGTAASLAQSSWGGLRQS